MYAVLVCLCYKNFWWIWICVAKAYGFVALGGGVCRSLEGDISKEVTRHLKRPYFCTPPVILEYSRTGTGHANIPYYRPYFRSTVFSYGTRGFPIFLVRQAWVNLSTSSQHLATPWPSHSRWLSPPSCMSLSLQGTSNLQQIWTLRQKNATTQPTMYK